MIRVPWADNLRKTFDTPAPKWRLDPRRQPVLVVSALGALAGGAGWLVQRQSRGDCKALPFSLVDFGLTFSAETFSALLASAKGCGGGVVNSLVVSDVLFGVTYAFFLSALYLWGERYLRRAPNDDAAVTTEEAKPLPVFSSLLVILPFIAAATDVVFENIPLWIAAHRLRHSTAQRLFVEIGSYGSAVKWTCLGVFALGFLSILGRGPRGRVLWHLRYSVIAVAVGSLALLVVPQGQDMLQRLVEGNSPDVRVLTAAATLAGTAIVVWYSARVLTLVRIKGEERYQDQEWELFFDRNVPRILGVAVLGLAGAAFARAGLALGQFVAVAVLSYFVSMSLLGYKDGDLVQRIGAFLIRKRDAEAAVLKSAGLAVVGSVLATFAIWPSRVWPFRWSHESGDLELLRVGASLMLVSAWLLYFFIYYRRDLLALRVPAGEEQASRKNAFKKVLVDGYPLNTLPREVWWAIVGAALCSLALGVSATTSPVWLGRMLGPLGVLALAIAGMVYLGSALAYLGRRFRLPIVTMLVALAFLFSRWNDNHDIRLVPGSGPPNTGHRTGQLQARFDDWLRARGAQDTGSIPVVLVAASGGGLRAAYWTALTLATLQDRDSTGSFARHVFAISAVSGGSLGAALYASIVRDMRRQGHNLCIGGDSMPRRAGQAKAPATRRDTSAVRCVHSFMNGDFLSPVLSKMVGPDLLQQFLPVPFTELDRSTALEQSWEVSYEDVTRRPTFKSGFLALYATDGVETPVLLLNTTHVQTGRRYITAPFVDDSVFLDARSVHVALGADLRLSTAVHNSARFPFVSPAGRIERRDGKSYGALVDGGYFENSGLTTLGDLRREIDTLLRARRTSSDSALSSAAKRTRVFVLYLCNDPISCRIDLAADTSLTTGRSTAGEWLSPLLALLHTRDARGTFARAQVQRALVGDFLQLNVCDSLPPPPPRLAASPTETDRLQVGRDRVVNPPLGWLLSRMARDWMDSSLTPGFVLTTQSPVLECRKRNSAGLARVLSLMPARPPQRE